MATREAGDHHRCRGASCVLLRRIASCGGSSLTWTDPQTLIAVAHYLSFLGTTIMLVWRGVRWVTGKIEHLDKCIHVHAAEHATEIQELRDEVSVMSRRQRASRTRQIAMHEQNQRRVEALDQRQQQILDGLSRYVERRLPRPDGS